MLYLYRNTTNIVHLPYFDSIDVNDVEFTIDDGCLQYPIVYNVLEVCNDTIKAEITIPSVDLKQYSLSLNDDNQLLKKYKVIVQEKDNSQSIGQPIGSVIDNNPDIDNNNEDNMNDGDNQGNQTDNELSSLNIDLTPQVIEAAEDIKDNLNADLAALMDL